MRNNLSYTTKLLMGLSLISMAVLTILMIDRFTMIRKLSEERATNNISTLGVILSEEIADDLGDGDMAQARKTLRLAAAQAHVVFISCVDPHGLVMFSSDPAVENKTNPHRDSADIRRAEEDVFIQSFPMNGRPVRSSNTIQIGFSLLSMRRFLTATLRRSLLINILGFVAIFAVAGTIANILLRPLVEMKSVSGRIAQGDFSARTKTTSPDLIGALGRSLNDMATRLDQMTHHLQDKIAAATRELALSNSDLARQQAELEESNRKLTELDRAKTEFVSIVSHELQTPLTNIIGFAQTIQKLQLPKEKIERYLKIIEFEGRRLAALIEDYLDVSKIEMGSFELRRTEFDMRDLIKETVPVIDVPPDITIPTALPAQPCPLVADKDRLKQVIVNVLSNAIRYTGPGGAIAIRCEDFSDRVLVHIQDRGPGIPADDQKRVFEKFFRRADDISKKSRGSGLGLYIVKNIIELHHGSVWIDSAPGEGSTFSFSLPKEGAQP